MNETKDKFNRTELANLAIDPDVLAKELAAELIEDPLDDIELEGFTPESSNIKGVCDQGLKWLQSNDEDRLQGLRVFCEHRDSRALPLLVPLLDQPCPVVRMSAVYALGRNPCPRAVKILLNLLQFDSNAYVRKASAWSLANYSDANVIQPLVKSLKEDVGAVRLWAASSLAEVASSSPNDAEIATTQLLISLKIDIEPIVRSNCIWSLGRLYKFLNTNKKDELIDAFLTTLLKDSEPSVRYEARIALEQLEEPEVMDRLDKLKDEGLLV